MVELEPLAAIVGQNRVTADELELICYSRDMSIHVGVPEAVVHASTLSEITRVVRLAHERGWPLTVRGAGTSVTGAILPARGGILLDLSTMNKIKELRPKDMVCVVEPGVICNDLNAELGPHKIFFPPDPGSSPVCTIGGMASLNASGLRAVKYGTTKDYVLALQVVLADGQVIRTGRAVPKTSSGMDLTRLFVSSEGTLGIITELTLKLLPLPEFVAFATACFEDTGAAGEAVTEMLSSGISLSACEIMDRSSIHVLNQAANAGLPLVEAMLIMEIDGHRATVLDQVARLREICIEHGATSADWSDDPDFRAQMWKGRKGLVSSLSRLVPGKRLLPVAEDLGVPISKIPEAFKAVAEISRKHDFLIATFGHVGDGNIHTVFIGDVRSASDWEVIRKVGEELVELTLKLGGTLSAEHGVGMTRSALLGREHGEAVEVMRRIKKALDPKGILNPGKAGLDDEVKGMFDRFAFEDLVGRTDDELAFYDKDTADEILGCVQCGFCRAACPVFAQVGFESRNARGRVNLAMGLMSGRLKPSQAMADIFYACTVCMNCTTRCPSAIKVASIVEATRKRLAAQGFMPEALQQVTERIISTKNPYGSNAVDRLSSLKPDQRSFASTEPIPGKSLVFMGCIPSLLDMKTAPSTLSLLEKLGIPFGILGENERCCGYPSFLAGHPGFEEIARANAAFLDETRADRIITPCAGCLKSLRQVYPEHGIDLGRPVVHLVELLAELTEQGRIQYQRPFEVRAIYHDPCDLGRHMGVYEPPRQVLGAVPGLTLLEFPRNRADACCCGGGGGLSAVDPELGVRIAAERVRQAVAQNAELIVSACAACKDNLKKGVQYLRKHGAADQKARTRIKVMDISEVVLASL